MRDRWEPGQLVVSTAGRDRGRFYLVLEKAPDNRVCVADGEMRRVANPKRKNEKHLMPCLEVNAAINQKIRAGHRVTDQEIRAALKGIAGNQTGFSAAGDCPELLLTD